MGPGDARPLRRRLVDDPGRRGGPAHPAELPDRRLGPARALSYRRFSNRGTDYLSESGMTRMRGGATRQRDRTLLGPVRSQDRRLQGRGLGRLRAAGGAADLLCLRLQVHARGQGSSFSSKMVYPLMIAW